jgi:hypothetical protein
MANSSRTRLLIITRQCYTAPSGQTVPTVSVGRELKYSRTSSCMRSISILQEAGYGRLVMSPIPASRRSSPARRDARKGVPYRDPLSQHRGLARFGVIDRSVELSPCANRCRRTDARKVPSPRWPFGHLTGCDNVEEGPREKPRPPRVLGDLIDELSLQESLAEVARHLRERKSRSGNRTFLGVCRRATGPGSPRLRARWV